MFKRTKRLLCVLALVTLLGAAQPVLGFEDCYTCIATQTGWAACSATTSQNLLNRWTECTVLRLFTRSTCFLGGQFCYLA